MERLSALEIAAYFIRLRSLSDAQLQDEYDWQARNYGRARARLVIEVARSRAVNIETRR